MARKSDATLFYSSYPIEKYVAEGISRSSLFVANNTVAVLPIVPKERNKILFIGTLYKEKRVGVLLDAYKRAFNVNNNICDLILIGSGDEYENIKTWILESGLSHKIKLMGAIFEEKLLAEFFSEAIMCISPDQAGLSVLKSMGYGVPFVTHKDAITGGEIFNIHNGKNGILMKSFEELDDILISSATDREKYIEMGKEAYIYYYTERTIEKMAQGFIDCIEYLLR